MRSLLLLAVPQVQEFRSWTDPQSTWQAGWDLAVVYPCRSRIHHATASNPKARLRIFKLTQYLPVDYSENYADDQAEGPDHPHDEDIP